VQFAAVLSGFLKKKGQPSLDLLINGSLIDEHDKEEE